MTGQYQEVDIGELHLIYGNVNVVIKSHVGSREELADKAIEDVDPETVEFTDHMLMIYI